MENICPLCNSLDYKEVLCKRCCRSMMDEGRAQEALEDDYTANMPINDSVGFCIHIFSCNKCGSAEKVKVSKITI